MTNSNVAHFIATRIEELALRQSHVAEICGFERPNVITMIKQGKTKLPMDKIGSMAVALQTDPFQLYRMCMQEYLPSTWEAIAPILESRMHDRGAIGSMSTNQAAKS